MPWITSKQCGAEVLTQPIGRNNYADAGFCISSGEQSLLVEAGDCQTSHLINN